MLSKFGYENYIVLYKGKCVNDAADDTYSGADPGGGAHPAPPPPPKIGKNKKIWFFCVRSWFFTRNTPKLFAPPSARRNFFKCAPLTWNPGSAPVICSSGQWSCELLSSLCVWSVRRHYFSILISICICVKASLW